MSGIAEDLTGFLEGLPQPVALAVGRVVRATDRPERLEAVLKAAEVTARYLSLVGMASAASARPVGEPPPSIHGFSGNLSFGTFVGAARTVTKTKHEHPLKSELQVICSDHKGAPGVISLLDACVQLRNELAHALGGLTEARTVQVFEDRDPIGTLVDCLDQLRVIHRLPLMMVHRQEHRQGVLSANLSFFTGENQPIPRSVHLENPIFDWERPYLCYGTL